jgi:hypothetical protein
MTSTLLRLWFVAGALSVLACGRTGNLLEASSAGSIPDSGVDSGVPPSDVPDAGDCLSRLIAHLVPDETSAERIWQYSYRGQTVYFLEPPCCDAFTQVYALSCQYICAPSGGLAGGDRKCPDFLSEARDGTIVWRAP